MPTFELEHISKHFGTTAALEDVSLRLSPGERVALVGENGAGKSTLMGVLYGMYPPDRGGVLRMDGAPLTLRSPRDALARGIGMVHQHFTLVPTLTVTENVVLGAEPTRGPWLDRARARAEVKASCARFGFAVDPDARVGSLTVGSQQKVEILKALHRGAQTLILDEPTAVLTPQEAEELFVVARALSDEGRTVVLISHKLRDVLAFATRIAVLRRGKKVGEVAPQDTSASALAELMVGPGAPGSAGARAGQGEGPHLEPSEHPAIDGALPLWAGDAPEGTAPSAAAKREDLGGSASPSPTGTAPATAPASAVRSVGPELSAAARGVVPSGAGAIERESGAPALQPTDVRAEGRIPALRLTEVGAEKREGGVPALQPTELRAEEREGRIPALRLTEVGAEKREGGVPALQPTDVRAEGREGRVPALQPRAEEREGGAPALQPTELHAEGLAGRVPTLQLPDVGEGRAPALRLTEVRAERLEGRAPALQLTGVRAQGLAGVTLAAHPGEILGIAGVDGNGQRELAEVLTGLRPFTGTYLLEGKRFDRLTPAAAQRAGVAHIPEDRLARALISALSVEENVALGRHLEPPFAKGLRVDFAGRRARAVTLLTQNDVRPPDPTARMGDLSGGNQQKLVVARELDRAPKVLIAVQPTRGLDLVAVAAVHARLRAEAERGCAVVLISLDLDEVLALADRVLVLFEGRVNGEFSRAQADAHALGRRMLGAA